MMLKVFMLLMLLSLGVLAEDSVEATGGDMCDSDRVAGDETTIIVEPATTGASTVEE